MPHGTPTVRAALAREAADELLRALAGRCKWTWAHCIRVGRLAEDIGHQFGLDQADIESLGTAGRLHDIGKLGVPKRILEKSGPLEAWEKLILEQHADLGAILVRDTGVLEREWLIIRWHHLRRKAARERRRGESRRTGSGRLASSIIAVADAFDAMTSDRPYRSAIPAGEAIDQLRNDHGRQFDRGVVEALVNIVTDHSRHHQPPRDPPTRPPWPSSPPSPSPSPEHRLPGGLHPRRKIVFTRAAHSERQ